MFDGNKVAGGDYGYYYVGDYNVTNSSISATVTINKHNPQVVSIFGNYQSLNLSLSGTISGNQISFSGHVTEFPQMSVQATMKKLTDLS